MPEEMENQADSRKSRKNALNFAFFPGAGRTRMVADAPGKTKRSAGAR